MGYNGGLDPPMLADGGIVIQTSHWKVLNKVRVKEVFLD